jgi:hypothetical protein
MSLNQAFAKAVMNVAKQFPVTVISDYAEQLSNEVDSFDIVAMKHSLNDFPNLIRRLEQLNNTNVSINEQEDQATGKKHLISFPK